MRRSVLLAVLLCTVAVSSAHATVVGIQNDAWMICPLGPNGISDELDRANQIHASWIRIMVTDGRWPTQSGCYIQAAQSAQARGKHVLVTLMAWDTHPTPAQWASLAKSVASTMGSYVDAWGIMNEPNQHDMAPAQGSSCILTQGDDNSWSYQIRIPNKRQSRWRWKHVKRGHGRYVRKWHRGHWIYSRAHGKARRRANWRKVHVRSRTTSRQETVSGTTPGMAKRQCTAQAIGTAYRQVWDAAVPVIRQYSSAPMCVGDQAVSVFNQQFMDAFYAVGSLPAKIAPALLCIHAYDRNNPQKPQSSSVWNVSNIRLAAVYARAHGLDLWVSEWAYWPSQLAAWWPIAMSRMRDAGAKAIFIYDTPSSPGHTWDTFMRPDVLLAVAGWQ